MSLATVSRLRLPPLVSALVAFGFLIAALVAAVLNTELRASFVSAWPLLTRYALVLALPALAVWSALRLARVRAAPATLLVLALAIGFCLFAGLAQTAALALLIAASLVVGQWLTRFVPDRGAGTQVTAALGGLGILVGLTGWVLPLRIHSTAAWIAVLAVIVFVGRRELAAVARSMADSWGDLVGAHALASFLCVAVVGFAAVFLWLPSLNPDDNSAHLLLGNQLLADGYSHLDASSQVASLAPWFNNVVHGLLALVSGAEARSATGLIWLLVGCAGAFRLAKALRADDLTALVAMALYASHPLTAYYGTTLQVDGASAACLLHLAVLCIEVERGEDAMSTPVLIGVLCGILAALKVTNLVYLAFFGGWLVWRLATRGLVVRALLIMAVAAIIAGSSYFYATLVTGNPLFPLYNGIFKSPYMPPVDFADQRWHSGISPTVLWDLTFSTGKYMEAYSGAAGLSLLALAGASLLALLSGGWRLALTLVSVVVATIVFWQVQYLRYIFPAMAVATTVAVVVFFSFGYRRIGLALIALLIIAQLGLVKTSNWILNAGVAEQMLAEGPKAIPRIEERFVPERPMIRRLNTQGRFCLLLAEPTTAYVALAPGKALTTAFYDSRMNALAQWANPDASGARWGQVLDSAGVTHVELRPAQANPGLLAALTELGFAAQSAGEAQLWHREGQSPERCLTGLLRSRDEARRLFD